MAVVGDGIGTFYCENGPFSILADTGQCADRLISPRHYARGKADTLQPVAGWDQYAAEDITEAMCGASRHRHQPGCCSLAYHTTGHQAAWMLLNQNRVW